MTSSDAPDQEGQQQRPPRDPAFYALVEEIADQLGETERGPRGTIARAVRVLGEERVRAFVAQALAVEEQGGMLLPDGSRKRTLGGVFFRLLRDGVTVEERLRIFPYPAKGKGRGQQPTQDQQGQAAQPQQKQQPAPRPAPPPVAPVAPVTWEEIAAELPTLLQTAQEGRVKITVIGRPSKVSEQGAVVTFALRSEKAPALPKGVPAPVQPATNYAVVVAAKQYRKVAEALAGDPEDRVVVEGYPSLAPNVDGIVVHATNITSVGLQRAKRAQQQADPATN